MKGLGWDQPERLRWREDRALDIVKLSTGITGNTNTELPKSNVIPIRSSKADAPSDGTSTPGAGDRFTRSSAGASVADGVTDTVTLSSVAPSVSDASARDARVARVMEAVKNGTYQVDSGAVANAMVSKMVNRPGGSAEE